MTSWRNLPRLALELAVHLVTNRRMWPLCSGPRRFPHRGFQGLAAIRKPTGAEYAPKCEGVKRLVSTCVLEASSSKRPVHGNAPLDLAAGELRGIKRLAFRMIIVFARGTSRPFSTMVVETNTSDLRMTASPRPKPRGIWPCPAAAVAFGTRESLTARLCLDALPQVPPPCGRVPLDNFGPVVPDTGSPR